MAIHYYEKGQLSSRFHGWHVTATLRGKRYQKYFSLIPPKPTIPADFWYRYQRTRARYYDARWAARSAALQYIDALKTNHPNTRPYRGVGFRGITMGITTGDRVDQERCYFSVNHPGNAVRFYITEECPLTCAWHQAVDHWGEVFGIRPKDIERKRNNPVAPSAFKALRNQLNHHEGFNISVEALHDVYAEQRAEIERQKAKEQTQGEVTEDELLGWYASLKQEITEFQSR
ncbi:hypothetical protein [Marinobacter persicus]|uniref:Uncharacterized protein n=1 Tax=Marinobacter persicus TaxID=930118 RepID=A0A2S6G3W4_9GAMM|nr:hypothetical protein [Marinobacter persicus]KXS54309.1 MAG: hypothetical protein AWU57_1317 [Marinobacter sp. T13-3]PPK50490.1 hypothetical protein BY455_12550 [Marinobacter persicus]PPK53772.1 hypothetical protein B0H24_102550 [Marinobacter persicus]PPK54552.1 hypothetical protein BY454_1753 [Marinobacter persicus]